MARLFDMSNKSTRIIVIAVVSILLILSLIALGFRFFLYPQLSYPSAEAETDPIPTSTPDIEARVEARVRTILEEQAVAKEVPVPAPTPAPAPAPDIEATVEARVRTILEEQAVAKEVPTPASASVERGVFRRLWPNPPTLDPHLSNDTTSLGIVVEVFSGLVALSPDLKLIPDIAAGWEVSPDGLQYLFHLRPYATFHNGKPVRAEDFKWSIERAANPDTGSPIADIYLDDIVGVEDVLEGRTTDISGIKVIDDHTLLIHIDAPKSYFLTKLTHPTAYVLDRENVEPLGGSWTDSPNGTGPFIISEYIVGERIVLKRNESFYRTPAKLDTIVMNLAGGQSMAMYENDEIDLTVVGLLDLDRVLDPNEKLNKELVVSPPNFSVSYIGFNTSMHPFKDSKFRQALNHAVDKEIIATEVLSESVVPAYGPLPPGFPGFTNLWGLRYDPDLAKMLLDESDYFSLSEQDKRIVITVPGTGGTIGLDLEVIISMWKDVLGVEVEIQQVEWTTYRDYLHNSKLQAYYHVWEADYPDPENFIGNLFHSESSINHGAYSNPEIDDILEYARIEPNIVERVALYVDAEKQIVQDAPWLPLWHSAGQILLIKSHVRGYPLTPIIVPKHQYIYLDDSVADKEVVKHIEIIKEVPVEVIKVVEKEVIKEVPVEVIKVVEKEVVRTIEVEKPVEVIKVVEKEVIKEVPVEVIKEVVVVKEIIKEVPVEVIKVVEKEVIKKVPQALPELEVLFETDRDGNREIYSLDIICPKNCYSGNNVNLSNSAADDRDPSWSPDGSRFIFSSNGEVYVVDADGSSNKTRVTVSAGGHDTQPSWSPDGSRIALVSSYDGDNEINTMNIDGSKRVRVTDNSVVDTHPSWSSDGTRIVFANKSGGKTRVYVMNKDGSNQTPLTPATSSNWDPVWSPDGSRIVFISNRDGNSEIYVMFAEGSRPINLTNNNFNDADPSWSPDSKQILFSSFRGDNWDIFIMNVDGSNPINLTNHPSNDRSPSMIVR